MVEVDLVLPETMSLKEAHDIGQSLQDRLEMVTSIERAFVHLGSYALYFCSCVTDYETSHSPEHNPVKKKLDLVEIE